MPAEPNAAPAYHHGDLRRVLVDAATAIVAEEQNWEFSLREVARRAGVSHNAPYRHFPGKLDLLGAIAIKGFVDLRAAMQAAAEQSECIEEALIAIGAAYVAFGLDNPARYRLMFGTALAASRAALPYPVGEAAAGSHAVLLSVIAQGIAEGVFDAPLDDEEAAAIVALAAWANVHGLVLLLLDGLSVVPPVPSLAERVGRILLGGIKRR